MSRRLFHIAATAGRNAGGWLLVAAVLVVAVQSAGCSRTELPEPRPVKAQHEAVAKFQGQNGRSATVLASYSPAVRSPQSGPAAGERSPADKASPNTLNENERRPADKTPAPDVGIVPVESWSQQRLIADTLARIGAAATPPLRQMLREGSLEERRTAARILAGMGPDAADAVPELTAALKHEDEGLRRLAIRALGQIGPAAAPAAPTLVDMLR